jgi:hypothetical protein
VGSVCEKWIFFFKKGIQRVQKKNTKLFKNSCVQFLTTAYDIRTSSAFLLIISLICFPINMFINRKSDFDVKWLLFKHSHVSWDDTVCIRLNIFQFTYADTVNYVHLYFL